MISSGLFYLFNVKVLERDVLTNYKFRYLSALRALKYHFRLMSKQRHRLSLITCWAREPIAELVPHIGTECDGRL